MGLQSRLEKLFETRNRACGGDRVFGPEDGAARNQDVRTCIAQCCGILTGDATIDLDERVRPCLSQGADAVVSSFVEFLATKTGFNRHWQQQLYRVEPRVKRVERG